MATRPSLILKKRTAERPHEINRSTDQQINRSTDQQINRSTDQQINRSTLSCFLLLIMLFSVGCDTQTLAVSTVADTPGTPPEEVLIDAGIVFADRPGYICVALNKLKIDRDDQPVSVTSSCGCVQPSIVKCLSVDGTLRFAILLEHRAKSESEYSESSPLFIYLKVTVMLQSGKSSNFSVKFLRSNLAGSIA
jgi:hypothetical protein